MIAQGRQLYLQSPITSMQKILDLVNLDPFGSAGACTHMIYSMPGFITKKLQSAL